MANKKQVTFIKVGPFRGPIKNGKFENWEADATVKGESGKGDQEVVVSVGSKGMADKFKAGTYTAFYSGKTESDVWRVTVLAADNEGLGAPKQEGFGGGSGGQRQQGGGYTRNPDEGCMASACGLVKSLIESGKSKITDVPGALEALKDAFDGVKKIIGASASAAESQKPAEEKTKSELQLIADCLKQHGLTEEVRGANLERDSIVAWWKELTESEFIERIKGEIEDKAATAPEDDADLPF